MEDNLLGKKSEHMTSTYIFNRNFEVEIVGQVN